MLPADGWPANTAFPVDKPPDWSWRLSLVRDKRPESSVPPALRQLLLPATDELKETDALKAYRAVAARHQNAVVTRFDYTRQTLFKSNFGLIRLSKDPNGLVLRHTLVSESGPNAVTPAEGTVHDISLAPSTEPAPGIVVR